jgi:cytochrome c oxidase cbb3-type subunit III
MLLFAHRAGVAALAVLSFSLSARSQQPPPDGRGAVDVPLTPAAIERGRVLFTAQCAGCHVAGARGGPPGAVDLTQSTIALGDQDGRQLAEFLKTGRPERRMPAFTLSEAEVADLASFLRSAAIPGRGRARGPVAVVVGNAKAGEAYFNGAGACTKCHSVSGDLKAIGSRLPAATIQGHIVLPRGNGGYPHSFLSPPDPNEAPVRVVVTPPSGPTVSGTLLWVTDFNVTLLDAQGVRRTFARDGDVPKVEITDPLQAHLDLMRTLTDEHMHDLTAYLVTVK